MTVASIPSGSPGRGRGRPTRLRRAIKEADRRSVLADRACYYCHDLVGPFEVEHLVGLGRGGTNDRDNLVCSCVPCNTQKGTLLLHEWIQWRLSNGMFWPPVATHATDPAHYRDYCKVCRASTPQAAPTHTYIFAAAHLVPDQGGYRCYYLCPSGHDWTCWYGLMIGYYSDCECNYCVARRLEATR